MSHYTRIAEQGFAVTTYHGWCVGAHAIVAEPLETTHTMSVGYWDLVWEDGLHYNVEAVHYLYLAFSKHLARDTGTLGTIPRRWFAYS